MAQLLKLLATRCGIRKRQVGVLLGETSKPSSFIFELSLSYLAMMRWFWYTDNQDAAHIVQGGSMKLDLHSIVIDIFSFCFENSVELGVHWIPCTLNQRADAISRFIDYDD